MCLPEQPEGTSLSGKKFTKKGKSKNNSPLHRLHPFSRSTLLSLIFPFFEYKDDIVRTHFNAEFVSAKLVVPLCFQSVLRYSAG